MNRWLNTKTPLILGHRGASADAPENTMQAFHLAIEQGADGFEFDVQLSADGEAVIIHDHTVDRVTNGQGKVEEMTLAQLQTLTVGESGQIPTLAGLFEAFGNQVFYNIEIKDDRQEDRGLESTIVRLVNQYKVAESCLITSFNPFAMQRIQPATPPNVLLGMIRYMDHLQDSYRQFSGQADHPHFSMVTAEYMRWAQKRHYLVNVWTVDDPVQGQRLIDLGVHGLITNQPGFLRKQLNM